MNYIEYLSKFIVPCFIVFVILYGTLRKVSVYDSFISGAKDAFSIVLNIFPYLLAIFVAVKTFQASGAFDFLKILFSKPLAFFNIPAEVFEISLIKPLSGSASLGIFTDIVKTTGPDSMATRMSAIIMGSAETTFYVIAVYLGAVNIKKTRYLIPVCLISDIIGIVIAIAVAKYFF